MTRKDKLLALAERAEAATGADTADLLREAFVAIHGPKPARLPGGTEAWIAWLDRFNPFFNLLTAKGFLDAAITLVPEGPSATGERFSVEHWDTNGVHAPHVRASAWVSGAPRVYAATPALALTAASLRATAALINDPAQEPSA